ncbi:hypothetical protein ACHAWF_000736, partial [Thalassiosira exigua]
MPLTVGFCSVQRTRRRSEAERAEGVRGSARSTSSRPGGEAGVATYYVKIPYGVRPGDDFRVSVGGHHIRVRCPPDGKDGSSLRIEVPFDEIVDRIPPPPARHDDVDAILRSLGCSSDRSALGPHHHIPKKPKGEVQLEVIVPNGVKPGQPFALLAGGVKVLVTCPASAVPGERIRFALPSSLLDRPAGPKSKLAEIKLSYDTDGWARTIRHTDMKFQWTRFDAEGNIDDRTKS